MDPHWLVSAVGLGLRFTLFSVVCLHTAVDLLVGVVLCEGPGFG